MNHCIGCQKSVTGDEIGICKRLIRRDITEYMCVACLADYFKCRQEDIERRIEYFRKMGCGLFK